MPLKLPNFLKITQNKGHFAVQGQYHTAVAAPSAAPDSDVAFQLLIESVAFIYRLCDLGALGG